MLELPGCIFLFVPPRGDLRNREIVVACTVTVETGPARLLAFEGYGGAGFRGGFFSDDSPWGILRRSSRLMLFTADIFHRSCTSATAS